MEQIKLYIKGVINGILLSAPLWDFVNDIIKALVSITGIVLTIVLIFKAKRDIEGKKLENKLKEIELEKKQQELADMILSNKKKHG
jgi:hypothetical protein